MKEVLFVIVMKGNDFVIDFIDVDYILVYYVDKIKDIFIILLKEFKVK